MTRIFLLALAIFMGISAAYAREYGKYDVNKVRTIVESKAGKKYAIDLVYLDPILHDLGMHARNYPAQFDTPQDRQRAAQDVIAVSRMLDVMVSEPKASPELLLRAGFVNMIGHNLDIPGTADKASANFKKLLKAEPADAQGNYLYGVFLAGEGKTKKAVPYLEKALAAGVVDAAYTLGMAHLSLGNKQKALNNFEEFTKRNPFYDESVVKHIEDIRNDMSKQKKKQKQ